MDTQYKPADIETRHVYGISLEQRRNDAKISAATFTNTVSKKSEVRGRWRHDGADSVQVPASALTDLIVATLSLKYTQSNSVCFAYNGGTIGLGAGQQSRIHCTRLAGMKADAWWLRHHPRVLGFEWRKGIKRADRANGTDVFVTGEIWDAEDGSNERKEWEALFAPGMAPTPFTKEERSSFFKELAGKVSLASDAFFPFPDNVMRATRSGVGYFAAPVRPPSRESPLTVVKGGSIMDDKVIETADEAGAVYIFTELRLVRVRLSKPCSRFAVSSPTESGDRPWLPPDSLGTACARWNNMPRPCPCAR